jgi:hypothetical protein
MAHERASAVHLRAADLHEESVELHEQHAVEMRDYGDAEAAERATRLATRERKSAMTELSHAAEQRRKRNRRTALASSGVIPEHCPGSGAGI